MVLPAREPDPEQKCLQLTLQELVEAVARLEGLLRPGDRCGFR